MALNIIFAGTPEFAARHLDALLQSEHKVCAVYTQPDRPSGRGKKLTASPVKTIALQHNISVEQPVSLKTDEAQQTLAAYGADLMVVVAYGLILPKAVLDIPRLGCINVHGSVLPRWRGAAPIQRAIEAGDTETGVTIMQMDVGLDTGDMLHIHRCPILDDDTSGTLHDRLAELGPKALIEALTDIEAGNITPEKQDDNLSNYAAKIEKHEAAIDWQAPISETALKIRAFNPFPVSFTLWNDERLRIHLAHIHSHDAATAQKPAGTLWLDGDKLLVQCSDGQLCLDKIQLPGKKAMNAAAFINGFAALLSEPQHLAHL